MTSFDGKAFLAGLVGAALVTGAILIGSRWLAHFDAELYWYAAASVLFAFAVAYRFTVWAQRPPSRLYFKRGFQLLFRRESFFKNRASGDAGLKKIEAQPPAALHSIATLGGTLAKNFAVQNFIRKRGVYRWIMHLCLSGGCTLAFAITFPLVFGWIHFESLPGDAETYQVILMGLRVDQFSVHGIKAALLFNLLNIAGVLVMIGLVMAAWRRLTDPGVKAVQNFTEDILPLLIIFAVTATGLMLTVSYKFLAGQGHHFMAVVHLMTVIALLFYIPFGKLFHIFQRTCSLCVSQYKSAGENGPRAFCRVCGEDNGSKMHVEDLKMVLDRLGFNYRYTTPQGNIHYQEICPACRRRLLAINQGHTIGR